MLKLIIPEIEYYDNAKEEFFLIKEHTLILEHSLISISKWESKYKKAFLGKQEKTNEEIFEYIKMMNINPDCDEKLYLGLNQKLINEISDYISDEMSATVFAEDKFKTYNSINNDVFTSELIYYYMFSFNIPKECEKWHINRLLKLIRVFSVKNNTNKKMNKSQILRSNHLLNQSRKSTLGTNG